MQVNTIRQQFIQFFVHKGHKHIQAAPIVNKDDPTLLFTNAGMNQFKDFFLGTPPPHPRAVSAQPCLRVSGKHNDLEEVGMDTYHHTLFEMLGNWSFGDYFKEEAIQWAWELLTTVYKISPDRLYVTVFGGDEADGLAPDTASQVIWQRYLAEDRILAASKKDNFWEMGDTGPCGPCTEIHVDIRPAEERQRVPGQLLVNKDHPQVIELWNLVFIQYNRLATGQLTQLPAQHVDTGMGLERLAMVLQAQQSNYDTDLFVPLIHAIEATSGCAYGQDITKDIAMRVMADHLRAVAFAIADGQPPSNVKAGYVIRRILRRAVRYAYTYLGFEAPYTYRLVPVLVQQLHAAYPQLQAQQAYIEKVIKEEEEAFLRTLKAGLQRLERLSHELPEEAPIIDGPTAFELYDTYGFPLDLTMLVAGERGLQVDEAGFAQALQAQRQRSKQAAMVEKGDWQTVVATSNTAFLGYDHLEATAHIAQYRTTHTPDQQTTYQLVLDQTPCYPEGGGQVGDTGYLIAGDERIAIRNTRKENDLIVHEVAQLPADLQAPVQVVVDHTRRTRIATHHTATHLLHAALRQVLGHHVAQRGSLVSDKQLRFDFSHTTKLTPQEIHDIERLVNEKIRANISLTEHRQMPLAEAKAMGAMALFGEKYGDQVRVVAFDPSFSVELCGGTHMPATGHLGFFKIIASAAVAAGVRRIEAVAGAAAEEAIHRQSTWLQAVQDLLKNPKDPEKAVQQLLQEKVTLGKQLAAHEATQVRMLTEQLRTRFQKQGAVHHLITEVTLPNAAALRQVVVALQSVGAPHFIVLTAAVDQKPLLAVAISEDLTTTWGRNARDIVQTLAQPIQGGGGGKPTLATAGGKVVQGLPQILALAQEMLAQHG